MPLQWRCAAQHCVLPFTSSGAFVRLLRAYLTSLIHRDPLGWIQSMWAARKLAPIRAPVHPWEQETGLGTGQKGSCSNHYIANAAVPVLMLWLLMFCAGLCAMSWMGGLRGCSIRPPCWARCWTWSQTGAPPPHALTTIGVMVCIDLKRVGRR